MESPAEQEKIGRKPGKSVLDSGTGSSNPIPVLTSPALSRPPRALLDSGSIVIDYLAILDNGFVQQRLAIARALLIKPDWLFLDEATSAIDEEEEGALYRTIATTLKSTTVISIGHRASLEAYHHRVITLDRTIGRPGRLIEIGRNSILCAKGYETANEAG